ILTATKPIDERYEPTAKDAASALHVSSSPLCPRVYTQEQGLAVGSPMLPVLANIFMEEFEKKALGGIPYLLTVFWRHVDDTFVVMKRGKINWVNYAEKPRSAVQMFHTYRESPAVRISPNSREGQTRDPSFKVSSSSSDYLTYLKLALSPAFWLSFPVILITANLPVLIWRAKSDGWWQSHMSAGKKRTKRVRNSILSTVLNESPKSDPDPPNHLNKEGHRAAKNEPVVMLVKTADPTDINATFSAIKDIVFSIEQAVF
ncbi:hypothetical protein T265_15501, partial [Opisthorchis viverrini]